MVFARPAKPNNQNHNYAKHIRIITTETIQSSNGSNTEQQVQMKKLLTIHHQK